ncbi:MAG: adenylyl-sulfate kinase [Myxococcales bacterium]
MRGISDMDLLRFSTAGSVDDGKSTLIGRLLFDSKGVFEDQLDAVRRATTNRTGGEFDLSLLTDGLRAEREQGITIDVAYRYFATPKRKFIIADTPGHEQYTRNMATGSSTANLSIVLIDARNGVLVQSRRHTFIASLLGIPHLVVAVNKMDLVGWSEAAYDAIRAEFAAFVKPLGFKEITYIPLSALHGDNVVNRTATMPWYEGPSLLEHLETVDVSVDENLADLRFPVQIVLRPHHAFRGFAGQIASGVIRKGDEVLALPAGRTSRVKRIHTLDGDLDEAFAPQSVSILLEDEIDISRGDMLVRPDQRPFIGRDIEARVVWMSESPLDPAKQYLIKQTSRAVKARFTALHHRISVNTLAEEPADRLALNEIGRVRLSTAQPLFFDPYSQNRRTGSFVVIDVTTNATVGAGMIADEQPQGGNRSIRDLGHVDREAREAAQTHKGGVLWLTGRSGSGKTTIARAFEARLLQRGVRGYVIGRDTVSRGLCGDVWESSTTESTRRIAETARLLADAGVLVVVDTVSPHASDRAVARDTLGPDWIEVFVDAPPETCATRAAEAAAELALAANTTPPLLPPAAPYEPPTSPDLTLKTARLTVEKSVARLFDLLGAKGIYADSATMDGGGGI